MMFSPRKPVTNYQTVKSQAEEKPVSAQSFFPPQQPCARQPGTLLRIYIPAGAAIDLLFLQIASPSGICLQVRIPPIGGGTGGFNLQQVVDAVQKAGGTVQVEG